MDQVNANQTLAELKEETIDKIKQRHIDGILEEENAQFLIKLIENAETSNDVVKISALGMSYKKTGFNFDIRLEKEMDNTVRYLQRNDSLSFNQPVGGGGLNTN